MDSSRLFAELVAGTPDDCVDVVLLASSIAAYKRASTPRDILERCWKEYDDERYDKAMRPVLDALCSPAL